MHMAQESAAEKNKGRKEEEREEGKREEVRTDTAALTHRGTYEGGSPSCIDKGKRILFRIVSDNVPMYFTSYTSIL